MLAVRATPQTVTRPPRVPDLDSAMSRTQDAGPTRHLFGRFGARGRSGIRGKSYHRTPFTGHTEAVALACLRPLVYRVVPSSRGEPCRSNKPSSNFTKASREIPQDLRRRPLRLCAGSDAYDAARASLIWAVERVLPRWP